METLESKKGIQASRDFKQPPCFYLTASPSFSSVLSFRKAEFASFCCILFICSSFPSFCLPLLPAWLCLPRSVRRLCWSVCWRSCGSWWWTPWRKPLFCRHSQTKRWEHSDLRIHTHAITQTTQLHINAKLHVWSWPSLMTLPAVHARGDDATKRYN